MASYTTSPPNQIAESAKLHPQYKERIQNTSLHEREDYWKNIPKEEQMATWEARLNTYLKAFKTDPAKKAGLRFLQRILRQTNQESLDQVEVTAKAIYNTFIAGEGRADIEFFARSIVSNNTLDEIEHNQGLIQELAKLYGESSAKIALHLTLGRKAPNPHEAYSIIGRDRHTGMDVAISQEARRQGLYIIGTTGTGKSTLIANLILTDIRQGLAVCLIEPHGDLTNTVIAGIPKQRLKDVIYLDITDTDYPFGLNLFECPEPRTIRRMAVTSNFVQHIFEKIWGAGTDTPRLIQVLRVVTRTLIENPGTTFAEIPLLFSSETVRAKMIANLTNIEIASFWEDYESKSPYHKSEYIESTMNKVNSFLHEPMVRNIVAQSKTTVDFRRIMDSGKILLVKLSPQFEEVSMLIGAIIIGKLLMAAFSREDIPEDRRRQFNLYCDEYQRFATSDFASLIQEAGRKFRVPVTLSHQTLSQLDEANRAAAQGAAHMIVFRVSGEDGKTLAKCFDTTPTKEVSGEEPIRAPVSDVISHLVRRGHNDQRLTRFAQAYLQKFEDLIERTKKYGDYPESTFGGIYYYVPYLKALDILKGREVLNETLYRCMSEKSAYFVIPPLALYMLAVAQGDFSEEVFLPFCKIDWIPPRQLQGFKEGAAIFGDPAFINQDYVAKFLSYFKKKEKQSACAIVKMITELRYTMDTLARHPVLVDTGQYQPKYQQRTYADRENEIARDLTQQPNFQARARLLTGEHIIRTKNSPPGLSGYQLTARINQIKAQMRSPRFGYCKYYKEVEREIRERQQKWQSRPSNEPPLTHY